MINTQAYDNPLTTPSESFNVFNTENTVMEDNGTSSGAIPKSKYTLASDEYLTCDYSRFESQLEALKTGNEFFKLRFEMIQLQLDKQSEILQRFEQKFDKIPQRIQSTESNTRGQIKDNLCETNNLIGEQNHIINTGDKWHMISDIKEIVKTHDVLFNSFSEKLNNVENILKKASWETSTRQLGDSISNKLTLLQNIDKKLTNVDTITMDQNRNIKKYLNQTEATKICLESHDQTLVCTTKTYPTSCADSNIYFCANNKCRIYNQLYGRKTFWVACDNHTEGGGWTVIQRRINGAVDFYRGWTDYKQGFGSIVGEFFIGLDKLHALTSTLQPMELMIQLQDFNETTKYAKYDGFAVGNESENYKLIKVGKYSGNATDSFSQHQGWQFTTKDRDNDQFTGNCAENKVGAGWYGNCFFSNLNGKYYGKAEAAKNKNGICWNGPKGCENSLKFVQMMIRPKKK
ncbi:angiopoietin-related protein 7-like [Calliphora vicina]|uniref:angiopoietin-related protein 7-like n=1 Tax=Calliphora vicina TaxID=7373 RepID=UPI00325B038A